MKTIRKKFRKNDKTYVLLHRNNKLALYGLEGEYTKSFTSYEVVCIYIRNDYEIGCRIVKGGETITPNSMFGMDYSRSFNNYNSAMTYFNAYRF